MIALACLGAGYLIRRFIGEFKKGSAEQQARHIIRAAEEQAEAKQREMLLEVKEDIHRLRADLDRESRERRLELQRAENRNIQKEEALDRKLSAVEKREERLAQREAEIERTRKEIESLRDEQRKKLEELAGLRSEEARELLLEEVRKETEHEAATLIKNAESRARDEAEKKARDIISLAIQRCAADHVVDTTVSVVALPNDEMKGRIIGREGRNIRALETLTGVDLIIDDTPEAVILSGFDPVRREVARVALERLITDGRIHPARIEEMVEKARKEVDTVIREEGERAAFDTGVHGLHPEVVKLLGRLKFRTSYGQNVLQHSMEVSYLAAMMAAEIGADENLARRAGLLHDIGKAVDHEVEGPHAKIGADILKRFHESPQVIHAVLAHHSEVEARTVEACLIQAADAVSAARPGARRETLESYIKRLEKLEEIAGSLDGVDKVYAMQAGREIRVMVKPEKIDDVAAIKVSRDIVKRIENELEYPGQIKVTVIRETRAVEYAK